MSSATQGLGLGNWLDARFLLLLQTSANAGRGQRCVQVGRKFALLRLALALEPTGLA
jgi:hypothetical protein